VVRVTGFCNRDFPLTTSWGRASHDRCDADWCECTHHVRSKELVRMADVARANRWADHARNALRLSSQLGMPVAVDHRVPRDMFIFGDLGLGSRIAEAHAAAVDEALAPYEDDLALGRLVLEHTELTVETLPQTRDDFESNHVVFRATERLRLRVPNEVWNLTVVKVTE
jgi:hypothetical protein